MPPVSGPQRPQPKPTTPSGSTSSTKPSTPQPQPGRDYHIQPGDTLSGIAKKAYGDASRWKEIADANPGHVGQNALIKAGDTIRIPADPSMDKVTGSGGADAARRYGTAGARLKESPTVPDRPELRRAAGDERWDANTNGTRRFDKAAVKEMRAAAEKSITTAENKRDAAGRAQDEARTAQAIANRAQAQATGAQNTLRLLAKDGDVSSKSLDEARVNVEKTSAEAGKAQKAADVAHQRALDTARFAITSQREANSKARAIGKDAPFPVADSVKDGVDAAKLDKVQQKELLGAPSAATRDEILLRDASNIQKATSTSPKQGAQALEDALSSSKDSQYRKDLVSASQKSIDTLAQKAATDSPELLGSLAKSSSLAGKEGSKVITDAVAKNISTVDGPLKDNLAKVAGTEAGQQFAAGLNGSLISQTKGTAADVVGSLSPEVQNLAARNAGARTALRSVEVNSEQVKNQRTAAETDASNIDLQARQATDDAFARANNPPPGTTVKRFEIAGTEGVELIKRDAAGNVLKTETALRKGDEATYSSTTWANGTAERRTLSSAGDKRSDFTATWKENPSKEPKTPSTDDLISRARKGEAGVEVLGARYDRDDGKLIQQQVAASDQGFQDVTNKYSQRTHRDGMHSAVKDQFSDQPPIDVVETDQKIVLPGQKEQHQTSTTWSQGNTRATRIDNHDEEQPKQWLLEKQQGNTYKSQRFFEGSEDFTTITTRKAEGNTVTEHTVDKGVDKDDHRYEATLDSTTTLDNTGHVQKRSETTKDPKGVVTQKDYERSVTQDKRGALVTEKTDISQTTPGKGTYKSSHTSQNLFTPEGPQFVGSKDELTGPDGTVARSQWDDKGNHELTVNGQRVSLDGTGANSLASLPPEHKELAAQAVANGADDVKSAIEKTKWTLDSSLKAANPELQKKNAASTQALNDRQQKWNDKLNTIYSNRDLTRAHEIATGTVKGVDGVAGLVTHGAGFVASVQNLNAVNGAKAAVDLAGVATSGATVAAAVKTFNARGLTGVELETTSARIQKLSSFGEVGGSVVGFAAGGLQLYQGIKDANVAQSLSGAGAIAQATKTLTIASDVERLAAVGGVAGKIAKPLAFAADGYQLADGIIHGNAKQITVSTVGLAGTVGSFAVMGAVGGPWGLAAGAAVGLVTFGAQKLIGSLFGDDEPKVAEREI